jgi:hypothetical protein
MGEMVEASVIGRIFLTIIRTRDDRFFDKRPRVHIKIIDPGYGIPL